MVLDECLFPELEQHCLQEDMTLELANLMAAPPVGTGMLS